MKSPLVYLTAVKLKNQLKGVLKSPAKLLYGVFLIDVVYSTKLIHRIKKLADENEVIVKYENLKAHVRSVHDRSAQKASFFFPLRSESPLNEHLRELRETLEQRRRTGGKKHAG